MDADRFARAIRCSVAEGALATVMSTLVGGAFLTAFALRLGASEFQVGLLAAATPLGHLAQLLGSWVVDRMGRAKPICIASTWVARLFWIPILLVPYVCSGLSGENQAWCIVFLLLIACPFASIGGAAWLSWIKHLVPAEMRLRFLGRRHVFNTALAFGLGLAAGFFIDAWGRWQPTSLGGYTTVFAVAVVCGLVGLLILEKIPDAPLASPGTISWQQFVTGPLRDANFRKLIGFYSLWNFAANLATPYFAVYMLTVLNLSFGMVTLLLTIASTLGLLATRFWTRLGDRFGTRNMVFAATLADVACPLLWLFASPEHLWLVVPIHLCGLAASPIAMGPNALALQLSPRENSSGYFGLFSAITGPMTAAGAVAGGVVLAWYAPTTGGETLQGFYIVFAVSAVGRLASLFLLQSIAAPDSRPVWRSLQVAQRLGRRRRAYQRLELAEVPLYSKAA